MAAPYAYLSAVYDADWGDWAKQYVAFIEARLGPPGPLEVLDLGCGTGTLAVALAQRGHRVLGVDLSPEMIAVARAKQAEGATFEVADMLSVRAGRQFDLALCTFDALNYLLEPADLKTFLANVADHLRAGGTFIFDSNTEHLYSRRHHGVHERCIGSERFQQECHYEAATKVATTLFRFSSERVERHVQRPHGWPELEHQLREAVLVPVAVFSDLLGGAVREDCERIVCMARKGSLPLSSA